MRYGFWQLLGLHCRHRYLSQPINGRRVCNECGAEFPVDYTVETWERGEVQQQSQSASIEQSSPKQRQ